MKSKTLFEKYLHIREEDETAEEGGGGVAKGPTARIKLAKQEGSPDFAPFTVNKTTHPNLRTIIKAFSDSSTTGVGYTTIEKNKGEVEPMLKKKMLWLTGGAVRDHLKGKTPKNYDLVTDATPSEMRMILGGSELGFEEIKPKAKDCANKDDRYKSLPRAARGEANKTNVFYISRWDKQGKEMEVCIEISGEQFMISTLSKGSKSKRVQADKGESASSIEEDSDGRDFTVNGMYIPLTQADGDNSELLDPHGGSHHIKSGEISPIGGDMESKLATDPSTIQRYIKLLTRFGDGKIPDKHKKAIERHKDMIDVDPEHIRSEFLDGLEHPDSDPKKYMQAYGDSGLLGKVFPGVDIDLEDMPADFKGDRWLAPAWVLRNNEPDEVKKILVAGGWKANEAGDISFLVKIYNWGSKNKFDSKMFYDLKNTPVGLTKAKIREWMQMAKAHGPEVDAFLDHDDKDLTGMVKDDSTGKRSVNIVFSQHLGRNPVGKEFGDVKKSLSTNRFSDMLNKLKPKG
jgi:tRNA nucleotidyltransferase/poly(A) polymerase